MQSSAKGGKGRYLSWLDAPETRTIPAPPGWLDKL
nr:MAG TPA: hypothetical protein [Caudoviricetes sp.]